MIFYDGYQTPTPLERGVWDVDEATYRADPALNFHTLKDFIRDPRAFSEGYFKREPKEAMDVGTACHTLFLEGYAAYAERVAFFEPPINPAKNKSYGATTKAYAEARAKFEAENAGKILLTKAHAEAIDAMRRNYLFHSLAPAVLDGEWGASEIAIRGELEVDGVKIAVKGRIDRYSSSGLSDFKTTANFDDASGYPTFEKAIKRYKYRVQLGFYHLLLTELCGAPFVPANIVCAEYEPPYRIGVWPIKPRVIEDCRFVALEWLRRYVNIQKSGYSPSRYDEPQYIDYYNPEEDL